MRNSSSSSTVGASSGRWKLAFLALLAVGATLLLSSEAFPVAAPVTAPVVPGAPGLPGPMAGAMKASDDMDVMKVVPDTAVAGTPLTLSGTGLAPNLDVKIVWMTASVRYVLDSKPDSVDYIGRQVDRFGVILANAKTDAKGAYTVKLRAPVDYGGLHDLYVMKDGVQLAKGGFLLERQVTISPTSGPVGTPITVKVVGMGYPTYESVGGVLWDNKFLGSASANTTRGSVSFTIRAAGEVGEHWLAYGGSSHTVPYLNMKQSPVPWTDTHMRKFTITKDAGPPANTVEWPLAVTPTVDARTTLSAASGEAVPPGTMTLDRTSGPILTKVSVSVKGLEAGKPVDLSWSTVVGNRVNCTGTCWNFVQVPLGKATAGADGTLTANVTVPDGLGGWHAVQALQGGKVKAQVPFFVKRSLVSAPRVVKAGQPFTIRLKGVGWTQLDNTIAVTYDNAYVGYACGFNSNGDTQIQMFATGKPGTHLIDLYPLLYTQQPAYPYSQMGMVPLLGWKTDAPGLAAGYELGAMRLAIKVVP